MFFLFCFCFVVGLLWGSFLSLFWGFVLFFVIVGSCLFCLFVLECFCYVVFSLLCLFGLFLFCSVCLLEWSRCCSSFVVFGFVLFVFVYMCLFLFLMKITVFNSSVLGYKKVDLCFSFQSLVLAFCFCFVCFCFKMLFCFCVSACSLVLF